LKNEQLLDLAKSTTALLKKPVAKGPKTDDELHAWIKDNLGLDIPRVAVCPDHQSPFEFLADLYFERTTSAIAIANRGGAKTMISAIVHLLNSLFKPGCESASVGAVEQQSQRAYGNLKTLLKRHGKVDVFSDHPDVERTVQRETLFKNGSVIEVIIGTPAGVNGPHPQKVHTDERELMDDEVFQESRNMSQSKGEILAQDWITSTRKYAHGAMQKLLDENIEAERAGADPPYDLYTWCVFEAAAPVPNCQVANPGCENPCPCDRVVKGSWEDGSPRRFTDVCQGRLARARGFLSLHDIHNTFRKTNQEVYEAQQLCTKPETSGLVLPQFSRQRHGVKWFDPDPANGPIFQGIDWGGTNPFAVCWYQVLIHDTPAYGFYQMKDESPALILSSGTRVCFDEIYKTEISNTDLADMVVEREEMWRRKYPYFRVAQRFADPQGKAARIQWANHNPPLGTTWFTSRDVKEQVKAVRDLVRNVEFRVDVVRCEMFCEEAEQWHYPKRRSGMLDDPEIPVDDFDHCMSTFRYTMIHLNVMEAKGRLNKGGSVATVLPQASEVGTRSPQKSGTSRYLPRSTDMNAHPLAARKIA
jgi:hypothetical protein